MANVGDGFIAVTWAQINNAEAYVVYWAPGNLDVPGNIFSQQINRNVFRMADLLNGTQYAIAESMIKSGVEGGKSALVYETPRLTPPVEPVFTTSSLWNSYILNDSPPIAGRKQKFFESGTTCNPLSTTGFGSCFHAAEH
mgnify:CR=1 FL=1